LLLFLITLYLLISENRDGKFILGGFMKEKIIAVVIQSLSLVLKMISPELKNYIKGKISEWEVNAEKTPNQFDDFLVELVKIILL